LIGQAEVTVKLIDGDGNPISGATVDLEGTIYRSGGAVAIRGSAAPPSGSAIGGGEPRLRGLERRTTEAELLDKPDFTLQEALETFRFLKPVNLLFGGIRPVIQFLKRESRAWEREHTYRILDAGCGIADVPIAIVRWARDAGYSVQIDAVDKSSVVADLARSACRAYSEIAVLCRDVFEVHTGEYDYVHASQLLHHVADEDVPGVLERLLGMCRSKLVINDLVRARLHYAATSVLGVFATPTFRHDSRISVRRGFTLQELRKLLEVGGYDEYGLEKHFFYRFLLTLPAPRAGLGASRFEVP
jgi:SAM-dependent methyltransferase